MEQSRDREAAVRLVIGVMLCAALLVGFVIGLGVAAKAGQSAGERLLGVAVLGVSAAGLVQLFRWARGSSWEYDRPRRGLGVSEAILLGLGSVALFGVLVRPLGPWALSVYALPLVLVARSRYGLPWYQALAFGIGLVVAIAAALGFLLNR
jgi:hypothetical protein